MIVSYKGLAQLRKDTHKTIVYAGGVFDLLHLGHLELLRKLCEYGEIVVVGVTPDARVKLRKGPSRPAQDEDTRLALIDALGYVDYAFIAPIHAQGFKIVGHWVLKELKPEYFVTSDSNWLEDKNWLKEQGTNLILVPRFRNDVSTTNIIRKIALSGLNKGP